ncbi:MAG: substrate-binding domain-containing protein [Flavobacterium sp.]|nr:substrate-binding domain-containing protein [Flavobacterium sp.]
MPTKIKHPLLKIAILLLLVFGIVMACKKAGKGTDVPESILEGKATVYVDESILPIVEDEAAVFESQYNAKLELIGKSESEIVNMILGKKAKIAILSRRLTPQESKVFEGKLNPKITEFATDAVAFISNKAANDTLVDLQEVMNLLQGKSSKIKGLVFDNPNSGTVRYMDSVAGSKIIGMKNIYTMKTNAALLKYVADNPGLVGVIGINSILQPNPEWQPSIDKINVMSVRNVKNKANDNKYYKPSQSNIAEGSYPLTRKLYLLNYQGADGLGIGFASFMAGEIGQRIILKSGLLPIRIPSRNITIRKEILNNK